MGKLREKYSIENLLRFTDRGASNLATSLLDEIVSKEEVDKEVPLYKLSNYKKAGSLIERYLLEGQKELESIASSEILKFMYNNGKGEERNMGTTSETVINLNNGVKENTRRKVCWKLDERGMLGESLLHVLVICNTDVHTHIAIYLLDLYPALAQDVIEGDEYYGASAIHFAIAYENNKLVKKLIEVDCNVLQRANGKFFMPIDQQWPLPRPKTNFEVARVIGSHLVPLFVYSNLVAGLSYFGEYPLAWAACCEDESSYNLLLKHGADPNMQDTFGNSILHVLVIRDKLKMYGYTLRHPHQPASDGICNKFGLTPLTLACKLGRNTIFREMLEFSSLEFWRYSNITCSGYPLNALDSIQPDGRANLNSALMIILKGNSTEHLDMLEGGVIQRLLEEKWKTFAQSYFYRKLLMMMFYLLNLSTAVYLRPTVKEPLLGKNDVTAIIRYGSEIITCIGCVMFGIVQQVQEISAQGLMSFFVSLTTSPVKTFFLISCSLILSCIPCRVVGDRETEDVLLCLAIPLSWFYLIFFAGAVKLTGPFVTMIYSMIVGDMFTFSIIYTIFLFGFTQAFYFLFKHPPSEKKYSKSFGAYPVTWMSLFHMTLGAYEYEEFRETYYQKLTQLVFAVFMVFTPILLLNMLIAMMGNTYCEVIEQSEKEWVKQWANIIVALEKAIDCKSAKEFLNTYSIKMPSPDKTEVRGVIVIKEKPKSKAKEKKQALSLWKRVGKRTIQELRRFNGKAAEVRKRYNLFRSKQPTARLRMGKVVQEWNPTPTPVYLDTATPPNTAGNTNTAGADNAGFNSLLSQVTSASGMDVQKPIEKPNQTENKVADKQKSESFKSVIKPPEYKESTNNSNGYVNLAFEGDPISTLSKVSQEQEIQHINIPQLEVHQPNPGALTSFNEMGNLQSNPSTQQTIQQGFIQQNTQQGFTQQNTQQGFVQQNTQLEFIQQNTQQGFVPQNTQQGYIQQNAHQSIIQQNSQQGIIQQNTQQGFIPQNPLSNSVNQIVTPISNENFQSYQSNLQMLQNSKNTNEMNSLNAYSLKTEPNILEKRLDVNAQSEQFQPTKEKGISVSIQTRIRNTRITKSKIHRRKDAVFPLRNEYSDSTSEKESKRGFLLYKKQSNGGGLGFKAGNKYKKRRKRNQIAFQEKIPVDDIQYNIPVSTENPFNNS